jgi:hypothetical protein
VCGVRARTVCRQFEIEHATQVLSAYDVLRTGAISIALGYARKRSLKRDNSKAAALGATAAEDE